MKKNLLIAAALIAVCGLTARAGENAMEPLRAAAPAVDTAAPEVQGAGGGVYVNDAGCRVTVEHGAYGSTYAIRDGRTEAVLGVSADMTRGDIGSYCSRAAASMSGGVLSLGCGRQDNGFFRTRGEAEIKTLNGEVTAVKMRGEVRRALLWFTDKELSCEGLRPVRRAAAGGLIDGWLDGVHHDHYAKDPAGSGLNQVLYVVLVKSDDKLYLQAFIPGQGNYLANFITSPAFAKQDLADLRSDTGRPYLVAFENYSTAVPQTNMLVVQFDGAGRLRFAIVQRFPTSEIKGGKFKPYVPSDADRRAWSAWISVS